MQIGASEGLSHAVRLKTMVAGSCGRCLLKQGSEAGKVSQDHFLYGIFTWAMRVSDFKEHSPNSKLPVGIVFVGSVGGINQASGAA